MSTALGRVARITGHLQTHEVTLSYSASNRPSPRQVKITDMTVRDIRFHTSKDSSGSDARSPDPDYSCAYIELTTTVGITASGLAFTIGRGNETVVQACNVLKRYIHGLTLADIMTDFNKVWRQLTNDDQLVWIGPEKGPVHQAAAGILNALWDLWGKYEDVPVWQLVSEMSPEQIVGMLDFSYVEDALTPAEALEILQEAAPTRVTRAAEMRNVGFPAYTTSTGWAGYPDEKIKELVEGAKAEGFTAFKMKVGMGVDDDSRRAALMRELIGWDSLLMMDANSVWGVNEAIDEMTALAKFNPYWIEEPTSPDDILGHATIQRALDRFQINVATGEQISNKVMHKQYLQAGGYKILQTDIQRLASINEYIVVALMARKFGVKVCIHAGGVGLCNMAAHLCILDFVAISMSTHGKMAEYIDHLQEHFVHPLGTIVKNGRYIAPTVPGLGCDMLSSSLHEFEYPNGSYWKSGVGLERAKLAFQ